MQFLACKHVFTFKVLGKTCFLKFLNTINSYKYSAFIKMKFGPEIHKDHKHLQILKMYRRFSHDWYIFREQYKTVVLKCYCSFIKNSIEHFCIYCHLTFACFCITPFGTCSGTCIKFYILCSCLYFCLGHLTIRISFVSLQYSTL